MRRRHRRAIAIVEARLQEMEQRLSQISESQTETAKAIGEAIITASAAYVAERFKDVAPISAVGNWKRSFVHTPAGTHTEPTRFAVEKNWRLSP